MDVQSAFDIAENRIIWNEAKVAMFKAFDIGRMMGMSENLILSTAQDTYYNINGLRADATIKVYFDEWRSPR